MSAAWLALVGGSVGIAAEINLQLRAPAVDWPTALSVVAGGLILLLMSWFCFHMLRDFRGASS